MKCAHTQHIGSQKLPKHKKDGDDEDDFCFSFFKERKMKKKNTRKRVEGALLCRWSHNLTLVTGKEETEDEEELALGQLCIPSSTGILLVLLGTLMICFSSSSNDCQNVFKCEVLVLFSFLGCSLVLPYFFEEVKLQLYHLAYSQGVGKCEPLSGREGGWYTYNQKWSLYTRGSRWLGLNLPPPRWEMGVMPNDLVAIGLVLLLWIHEIWNYLLPVDSLLLLAWTNSTTTTCSAWNNFVEHVTKYTLGVSFMIF